MSNPFPPHHSSNLNRRKFIINTVKTAGGLALLSLKPPFAAANVLHDKRQYTVQQIIDLIMKEGQLTPIPDTTDTIKSGSPDQVVTGIVTTMFPTIAVIEEAAKRNANFIVAHEPSFYNHHDSADWVKDNAVLKQKQALLKKHNIAIWRFHDYCHRLKPDAISYGVVRKAGWLPYFKEGSVMINLPSLSLQQLVQQLKSSLGIAHIRVIGNLEQTCERIAFLPGAWGGQRQITMAEANKPDVLIVGEVSEWETAEYIRDGNSFGSKMALVILGHGVSEEPGMEWVAEWLQPMLPELNVTHITSGDPFIWL